MEQVDQSLWLAGERLFDQSTEAADGEKLAVEYRYAMDCFAKVLVFGRAWVQIAEGQLSAAKSTLLDARAFSAGSTNLFLGAAIKLLEAQIRRHSEGYDQTLRESLRTLSDLRKEVTAHPIHWRRVTMEMGLHLVHLLRDAECDSKHEFLDQLRDLQKDLSGEDQPVKGAHLIDDRQRHFQAKWLEIFIFEIQASLDQEPHRALSTGIVLLHRLREDAGRLAGAENQGRWPLQYSPGQIDVLLAKLNSDLGRAEKGVEARRRQFAGARDAVKTSVSDAGAPEWLRVLALVRRLHAEIGLWDFRAARETRTEVELGIRRCEIKWVCDEFDDSQFRLDQAERAANENAKKLYDGLKLTERWNLSKRPVY